MKDNYCLTWRKPHLCGAPHIYSLEAGLEVVVKTIEEEAKNK